MTRFVVLPAPSGNRVYAGEVAQLGRAELRILAGCLRDSAEIHDIEVVSMAGVEYVAFTAIGIERHDLDLLANLSGRLAVFEVVGELLRPVELSSFDRFDDDLMTIPKYPGKTNEQFTKLLLNVTLASSAWANELGRRRFSVFDPMAGRGTSLDQALTYGFDATGVEIDGREVEAYSTFLSTYLKRKRIKHTISFAPVRRDGKRVGRRLDVEVNADPEAYKRGDRQRLTVHCADTLRSAELFGKQRFDLIVTDAPYGVVHGSRSGAGRERSARDLLAAAVPIWARLLRPGGALGIAWNTLGLPRADLAGFVCATGLRVEDAEPYLAFEHRVDSSIVRDILIATRP